EKLTSNDFTLSSKRNTKSKAGRFWRTALGIVVGGMGASLNVVIVALVEGVMIDEAVIKMDSTPASLVGFSMLVTNDDTDELSC
nr:hypothetical protein [Tanacetum cinerariifolium]